MAHTINMNYSEAAGFKKETAITAEEMIRASGHCPTDMTAI
jgi:hypothetical protein